MNNSSTSNGGVVSALFRRFLGQYRVTTFNNTLMCTPTTPPRCPSETLLHFLTGSTYNNTRKLHEWARKRPDEFQMWCRHAAQYHVDEWGEYPLHRACRYGSTEDVRIILRLYPTAATIPCRLERNLPLHCALLAHQGEDVLYMLLMSWPDALHSMNTQQGLPLHTAVAAGCPTMVIQILYHCYPQALAVANLSNGETPIHIMYQKQPALAYRPFCLSWWTHPLRGVGELTMATTKIDDTTWETCLQEALTTRDAKGRTPMHVAIEQNAETWEGELEELLRWSGCRKTNDAVNFLTIDDKRQMNILHLMCHNLGAASSSRFYTKLRCGRRRNILTLLKHYPEIYGKRNLDGELPIQIALQHGAPERVVHVLLKYYRPQEHGPLWESLACLAARHDASISVLYLRARQDPAGASRWLASRVNCFR